MHSQSINHLFAVLAISNAMSNYKYLITMQIFAIKNVVDSYKVYKGEGKDVQNI